jgi:hypothetical protein
MLPPSVALASTEKMTALESDLQLADKIEKPLD